MSTCVMMMSKSNNLHFASSSSSIKIEEESSSQKQGIVSILGSDCESSKSSASSLRRTLSADMSSKKWLAQNGFNGNFNKLSPMKRIASSEELLQAVNSSPSESVLVEDDQDQLKGHGHPGQDEVWRSIQAQKKAEDDSKWTWGSILFEKRNDQNSSKLPPPYIPPLMRRSTSGLSEKSLEICTESLGSETGSDGFSSYPPSEAGDVEDEKVLQEQNHQQQQQPQIPADWCDDLQVAKYSYSNCKKVAAGPRSFPPPLPSLARDNGASVHMQSRRQNGRLVLEAVSVPSQNYFQAHREHGRLRLSFVDDPPTSEEDDDEVDESDEQVFDNFEDINDENDHETSSWPRDQDDDEDVVAAEEENEGIEEEMEEEEEEYPDQMDENPSSKLNVHKPTSTILVKKLMGMETKNLSWSSRFNRRVNLLEVDQGIMMVEGDDNEPIHPPPLPRSLPPAPPMVARMISNSPSATSAAASFNAYQYFWRESKPTMAAIIKPVSTNDTVNHQDKHNHCSAGLKNSQNKQVISSNTLKAYEQQQNLVVMRGGNKAEYLVPFLKRSCNESRISLLLWEPYCIAT